MMCMGKRKHLKLNSTHGQKENRNMKTYWLTWEKHMMHGGLMLCTGCI